MNTIKHRVLPVIMTTLWISVSEFFRNEYLLKSYWTSHYLKLGMVFPSEPINGAIWGLWSLVFAIVIFMILHRFSFWQTVFLSWLVGFVMMWLVIGNMGVLPMTILSFAIPLSLLEVYLAALILTKLTGVAS